MTEQIKKQYNVTEITLERDNEEGVKEEKPYKQISLVKDGTPLFVITPDFTDEQINQVFNIAQHFHNQGIQAGYRQHQQEGLKWLGLQFKKEGEA